jgi:threonine aldolase
VAWLNSPGHEAVLQSRLLRDSFLHKLHFVDHIDFRSDTVTWPTAAMRNAMAEAVVGDDGYGEDPTVRELEDLAAQLIGKEAAVFVSSGTMGNLIGILSHATRGDGAIVGLDAHAFTTEAGGMSAFGGVVPQPLATDGEGRMELPAIEQAISPDYPHYPRSSLILLENTYGAKNGYPIEVSYFARVREIADRYGLAVHLDGARLFNAVTALGIEAEELTQHVDSVTFCLSKGLCAPVGSLICGSSQFAHLARRARIALGGGMRQAGVIAAPGIVALQEMVGRLAEDHANARRLAEGLATIPGIVIDPSEIKTNIVFFHLQDDIGPVSSEIAAMLFAQDNILVGVNGPHSFRVVTHFWVGSREVDLLINGLRNVLDGWRRV